MKPNQLSANFWLEEFVVSQAAGRLGLDNRPPLAVVENLRRLAFELEGVRAKLAAPIQITSGYRSAAVNRAIGGAPDSAHLYGLAADIICPSRAAPSVIFGMVASSDAPYDQLIDEFGRWVHFAIAPANQMPRRELLRASRGADGVTRYERVPSS